MISRGKATDHVDVLSKNIVKCSVRRTPKYGQKIDSQIFFMEILKKFHRIFQFSKVEI
jgi:hypothetical protein